MKKQYLFMLMGCLIGGSAIGQTSFSKTIVTNQPTELVADAGSDIDEPQGTDVKLGDTLAGVASGGTTPYTYAWSSATGLDDASLANPTATVGGANQNYSLSVTDARNCTSTDDMDLTVKGLSLLDLSKGQVKLFPVPTQDVLFIENGAELKEMNLFNLSGQSILRMSITDGLNQIDLSNVPAGIYELQLMDGKQSHTSSIVVR